MADDYCEKFEPYQKFFKENEALDLEKLQEEEHGVCVWGGGGVGGVEIGMWSSLICL